MGNKLRRAFKYSLNISLLVFICFSMFIQIIWAIFTGEDIPVKISTYEFSMFLVFSMSIIIASILYLRRIRINSILQTIILMMFLLYSFICLFPWLAMIKDSIKHNRILLENIIRISGLTGTITIMLLSLKKVLICVKQVVQNKSIEE